MKLKKSSLVLILIWSLFMGVTAISIGIGALFPSLNYISAPFVCPGGTMSVDQQTYNPYPGSTVTTATWYCTNGATGEKQELDMWSLSVPAGLIYGFLLFLVILVGMQILARRSVQKTADRQAVENSKARFARDILTPEAQAELFQKGKSQEESTIARAKIEELRELRSANIIGESEYQRRVWEIEAGKRH